MFERFTEEARRVIVYAQKEARNVNQNYIGTEHLLLGLMREEEGIAYKALTNLGVNLIDMRLQVANLIGKGVSTQVGHIPFTPQAKKTLEFSLSEALQLGHNHIGTEHILLGLIREGEGVAARVLINLGVDIQTVRIQILQLVGDDASKEMEITDAEAIGARRVSTYFHFDKKSLRILLSAEQKARGKPIASEHILLGICSNKKSLAKQVLNEFGVNLKTVREKLKTLSESI